MATIGDMIVDQVVAVLKGEFAAEVAGRGKFKVGLIRGGRLQEDGTVYETCLLVHQNDPDDAKLWEDTWVGSRKHALDKQAMLVPPSEIGGFGPTAWWRRFVVEIQYFGATSKVDRDTAREYANIVKARIERALATATSLPGMVDELGETSLWTKAVAGSLSEGGGPPNAFIWRGKVFFQVLTERPY